MSFPRSISFLLASLLLGGAAACAGAPTADSAPVGATTEAVQGDHPELESRDAPMQEVEKHSRQRGELEAAREAEPGDDKGAGGEAEPADDRDAGGEAEPADDKGGHGKP